ncbi:MAG TPA: methyltransferase domain-containing protein [Longimicrobiaceae bacterium]|nr:methyltransferase domain-containing protein [Longimicrobiaceae bacterium]
MSGDPRAALRESWERNAAAWIEAVRGGHIPSRRAGTDAAVLEAVLRAPGPRVLDVGCGEGWLARALAALGREVVGIDGSEDLVRRAREAGGGVFRTLRYDEVVADPARLGGPFDAAVCNFALLGAEVAPLLRALGTALAPGGRLVVQTLHPFTAAGDDPYRDGWRVADFAGFAVPFPARMPWYFRTVGSWLAEARRAGLETAAVEEPLDPATGRPLSLLLVLARPGEAGPEG